MINFEHPEDREYFANLLANGDVGKLDRDFSDLFDFEHPAIKREKFNKIKKKVFKELIEKYGNECQLKIHPDCSKVEKFEVDHIIPLSSNELNKKLRGMTRFSSEKVERQSFGSNNMRNMVLACKRCNAFKKHKFLDRDVLLRII
jgi:5-methylcytosine-specific restriction endonuclease McrA